MELLKSYYITKKSSTKEAELIRHDIVPLLLIFLYELNHLIYNLF